MKYFDADEAARLNAKAWQIDLLSANPEYLGWGPHEDYMWKNGDGWDSRQIFKTWVEFGPWALDDLNECVNFYFSIHRASKACPVCGGSGTHPDAQWVSESFYSHSSPFKQKTAREVQAAELMRSFGGEERRAVGFGTFPSEETLARYGQAFREFCEQMRTFGCWRADITEDEAAELVAMGRAKAGETATDINARELLGGFDSHDAINRWTLARKRCERFGIPYMCHACEGHGETFTELEAHVSLTLWWIHPRKGCSRGLEVSRIEHADLPAVSTFLDEAARRNAQRFRLVGSTLAKAAGSAS